MTKVVIDTNVLVSSFFGGLPRKIIDLWKKGAITICLSRPIVDEYVGVLERLGLDEGGELGELLQLFASSFYTLFTASPPALDIVSEDADDNKFIECAVALKSQFIISGDKHLKNIGSYMGVRILSPREFMEIALSKD